MVEDEWYPLGTLVGGGRRGRPFSAPTRGATPRRLRAPKPVTVLEFRGGLPPYEDMRRIAQEWRKARGLVAIDGDTVSVYTVPALRVARRG